MRYLIKVYTLTDEDDVQITRAIEAGLIQQAERLSGFTQGMADAKSLAALVAWGLNTISVEEIGGSDVVSRMGRAVRELAMKALSPLGFEPSSDGPSGSDFAIERADGQQNYLIGRIVGSLTPSRLKRLNDAGVQIVERRDGDTYVIKATSAATLGTLDFVTDVKTYGAGQTVIGDASESPLPRPLQEFEALVHADVDAAGVAATIAAMGGSILSSDARTVRFAPGNADLMRIADMPDVAQLTESRPPRLMNDASRAIVGLAASGHAQLFAELDGTGQIVGVADTGIDDQHPDLRGRFVAVEALGRPNDHSDQHGHGTHVTGTIAGSGAASAGALRGVAPGVRIHFQSLLDANGRLGGLPADIGVLFSTAYAAGVRIHNNSWGAFLEARYGTTSIQVDRFVCAHPDFLPVIAAGNDGRCAAGTDYRSSAPGFVEYPSIATPGSAKNGLTVGASRSDRTDGGYSAMTWKEMWPIEFPDDPIGGETVSGNAEALAGFSSRGPVDNDAIKPDLVAPGTDIASTRSSQAPLRNFWGAYPGNAAYAFMGGTSMAAPLVAGAAALVRQYYVDRRKHSPSAALVKATLINGTVRLTHADAVAAPDGDPNFHQGFGRLDMSKTLPSLAEPASRLQFIDTLSDPTLDFTVAGERRSWMITTDAPGELRLCLVWSDFPATGLQNSLILFLDEIGTPRKWASNQRVPQLVRLPTRIIPGLEMTRDPKNNVQTIRVPDGIVGDYGLRVIASNIMFPTQSFAVVVTGPVASLAAQ